MAPRPPKPVHSWSSGDLFPTRVIVFQLGEVDDEDMRVENPKLAVLGLGTMESAIARTALRSEIPLAVWNRGVEATEPFGIAGRRSHLL
jgi:hypothetical protein